MKAVTEQSAYEQERGKPRPSLVGASRSTLNLGVQLL